MSDPSLLGSPDDLLHVPATGPWRWAAFAWLLCVLWVGVVQWQFWREGRLQTDVLALLPASEQSPAVGRASQLMSERVSRQVVVLLGAPDWGTARQAANQWRDTLAKSGAPLRASDAGLSAGDSLLAFHQPWRDRLLTSAQRAELEQGRPGAQVQRALALLYQPGASGRIADWASDPLGLWPQWLQERATQTRARPRDGELWVSGQSLDWVVLTYEITGAPFAMSGDLVYAPALESALQSARATVPEARMLAIGLPLHAEAAAQQASREVNTIGWGSLAAIVALAWFTFRAFRPILLTALSLVVGIATALSVTGWMFGHVHLLTLVFGASLVGVAEDYGIHYFAARQGRPWAQPRSVMRSLLPGLVLALATSVIAYLALGLTPFPGLRQMAVFSAAGLAGAFFTAVCWFPLLDRGRPTDSRFAAAIRGSLERWPRWRPGRSTLAVSAAVVLVCIAGLLQLRASDQLRDWQGSPPAMLQAQREASGLLGTASVAQFYLVRGATPQEVLEREEALKRQLDPFVRLGALAGYSAVSDWVPSLQTQRADARLTERVERQVLAGVNAALGENIVRPARASGDLTVESWLAHAASAPARHLWLGPVEGEYTTVVLLNGLHDSALLPRLAGVGASVPGVRWIDRAGEVSSLLGRYRMAMTALLLAGHLAVFAALWARFRSAAWRAWLPTALASALTVGILGWLGEPFQLANVLALVLLLGIGVDYGIFLLEHEGDGSAWLAVVLGAASTWLAFGLLALSSTPALHAFGLTLLIGIGLVWAASPWMRLPSPVEAPT